MANTPAATAAAMGIRADAGPGIAALSGMSAAAIVDFA